MSVEAKVTKIIVEQLGVKEEQVMPEADLADDLGPIVWIRLSL